MSKENIGAGLHEYESKIWKVADLLRGNGFKQSEWPNYMMPFFALLLTESRIVRLCREKIEELEFAWGETFDRNNETHIEDLNESIENENYGYHPELVKNGRTLQVLCETQPANFYQRLTEYLNEYDQETKTLLGIDYASGSSNYLGLQTIIGALNAKNQDTVDVLYNFTKEWAVIDLSKLNNSEVTTIEEHIKRKWADISAETAGQHYTPFDIIELCTDLNVAVAPIDPEGMWSVYDMTCGGGNFLFGLEDSLREVYPNLSIESCGQEYNDQLYALGAIESRFRPAAKIEYGNTLTNDKFAGEKFGSVIGNPPYGGDWKEFQKAINNDKTGRFHADKLPPISDSQTLFLQHAVSHMADNGVGTIVLNGSPLTSGDAGGGESNIRRYLLKELDIVQAIIQLPQGIFFNTSITTYIWVLNKNKPESLKDKVMLINAENLSTKLKKSLNKKANVISEQDRQVIVDILKAGLETDIAKVVTVDELMYNKVEIEITRQDEAGNSVPEATKLTHVEEIIINGSDDNEKLVIKVNNDIVFKDVFNRDMNDAHMKESFNNAEELQVITNNNRYTYISEENIVQKNGVSIGKGVMTVKMTRPKKLEENQFKIEVSISPLLEKDNEITPYSSDKDANDIIMNDFLAKWVSEPHRILEYKEGCEINFN